MATKKLYGHVFCLRDDGTFFPYEFLEGESNIRDAVVDPAFFKELASFININGLANLLALECLVRSEDGVKSMELMVGENSTVAVDEKDVVGFGQHRLTTGCHFQVEDDGIISCKGDTAYARKVKGTHQVFVSSKPLPTVEAQVKALQEGILAPVSGTQE